MTIVISGPREIECYKRVRSDKGPVIGVSQNGPAVVSKIVHFIMIQLIRRPRSVYGGQCPLEESSSSFMREIRDSLK